MPAITSMGIGSGLDIRGLVDDLVEAERAPTQNRIDRNAERAQDQLSAMGTLKGLISQMQDGLSDLRSRSAFQSRTAESSAEDVFTVSATRQAVEGAFTVQVEELAQSHRIASREFADGAGTEMGSGTLTLSLGNDSFQLAVPEGADSLAQIRDAINVAPDNPGITASIINTAEGARLTLTSQETGADNVISVSVDADQGGSPLEDLAFDPSLDPEDNPMSQVREAQDALVFIDDFAVTSSNNTLDGVIDGVTLNLRDSDPGEVHNLVIAEDRAQGRESVEQFVASYNELISQIRALADADPEEGTSGPLTGDSTARTLVSQMRNAINSSVDTGADFSSLAGLGIVTRDDGTLEINDERLDEAISNNYDAVGNLFAGEGGLANAVDTVARSYTQSGGILDSRSRSLENRLQDLGNQQERLDRRMARVESRYISQFTAMDQLVAQLQETSSFLDQQLGNLPFNNR
ncbi:flagellar filament capping protein FliD [Gammaproteobacteria bacterium AB-CW1]|uniref:Flagellar hook-associated protein 2 n=2 Tax=Natronospira TaxID=2024969 RepID=A0AAP6JCT0_9GAMM|nr:flagellar filament capping protein FliD [Gammaproteobacteria bacterium AB-CW1]